MNPQKTTVDWLRFRVQEEPRTVIPAMKPMFGERGEWLHLKHLPRGVLGFQQGAQIMIADKPVGRMDYGGESQKGWVRVDLSGQGCELVEDWEQVGAVEELQSAQVRRLDLALTTWKGEVNHEQVVQAHTDGKFITRGRPPKMQQILSSDPRQGRTCYIGEREKSDKFMRCYEKGFQMANLYGGKMPGTITHISDCRIEDIYRCEVELKAANTVIPWEVIDRRDQYFAGAYPFCADILPNVECDILKRRPEREAVVTLAAALENCRVQFGPTLFTALAAYHGDMTAIWDKIIGDHHSQALLEAGVLLFDHE